ncbi:MAG: hypothetical protein ABJL99_04045 [Aliishimia sp.]
MEYKSPQPLSGKAARAIIFDERSTDSERSSALVSAVYYVEDETFVAEIFEEALQSKCDPLVNSAVLVLDTFVRMRKSLARQRTIKEILSKLYSEREDLHHDIDDVLDGYEMANEFHTNADSEPK